MTVQQDLDHEMVQLGRDMDGLKEQFKSLFARLSRLAVVVIIAIIIGAMGCIL